MLRSTLVLAAALALAASSSVWAASNPLTQRVADQIATETDTLRLPCPDWLVEGAVDLHGPDAYPECILFEHHTVYLARMVLDSLVRYEAFGQWVNPWVRSGVDEGAYRFLMLGGGLGFLLMLVPEGEHHVLLHVTMPPEDVQESLQLLLGSD